MMVRLHPSDELYECSQHEALIGVRPLQELRQQCTMISTAAPLPKSYLPLRYACMSARPAVQHATAASKAVLPLSPARVALLFANYNGFESQRHAVALRRVASDASEVQSHVTPPQTTALDFSMRLTLRLTRKQKYYNSFCSCEKA